MHRTHPFIRILYQKKVSAESFDTALNLLGYDILQRISRIYSSLLLISSDDIVIFASVSEESQRL